MKKDDCIFCKIANGEIPSKTLYEDEDFRVILDLGPATRGHALILPKEHADNLYELPEDTAAKTFVLAKKMGYQFIDSDIVIQQKYAKTLEQLIDEHSDAGFIQIENDVNKEIKVEHTVIATGGSVVYGREAMEHFKKTGVVVYLKVPEEELKKRLGSLKERGVVSNGKATIAEIFEDRKALYEQYADITVTCANEMLRYSVEDVYAKINAYFAENYVTKE